MTPTSSSAADAQAARARTLTVVVPTHQRQELTDRAVESVRTRTPARVEIVVVDDAGPSPYAAPAPHNGCGIVVRVLRLARNLGPSLARAHGVSQARSEHVMFLDSDDLLADGWVDFCLECIDAAARGGAQRMLIAGCAVGGNSSNIRIHRALSTWPRPLHLRAARIIVPVVNLFYTPGIAMHRELFEAIPDLRHCEDYYSVLRAVFRADDVCISARPSCLLGRPPGSIGGLSADARAMSRGESTVRRLALRNDIVPWPYHALVGVGYLYQFARTLRNRLRRPARA